MRRRWLLCMLLMLSGAVYASHIDTLAFQSDSSDMRHRMCVYLPDGYTPERTYPVLYLLHGIHGNQYIWQKKGHMQQLMDSLIREERIEPVVVVMPFCQIGDTCDKLEPGSLFRCCMKYPQIKRGKFERFFHEITAYAEAHYSIRSDKDGRLIAGLSCGARQAANIAIQGNYGACGLFSPVLTRRQLPECETDCPVYWISGGKRDFFLPMARQFHRQLTRQGQETEFVMGPYGHSWPSWQLSLCLFTERFLAPNPDPFP